MSDDILKSPAIRAAILRCGSARQAVRMAAATHRSYRADTAKQRAKQAQQDCAAQVQETHDKLQRLWPKQENTPPGDVWLAARVRKYQQSMAAQVLALGEADQRLAAATDKALSMRRAMRKCWKHVGGKA